MLFSPTLKSLKGRLALLDILEDRHGRMSTILISQLSVSLWHDSIRDSTIADAIIDRIAHNSIKESKTDQFA